MVGVVVSNENNDENFGVLKRSDVSLQDFESTKVLSGSLGTSLFVSYFEVDNIPSWSLPFQTIVIQNPC